MNLKMAKTYCYEHQGAYLWLWQDYAGAWWARAGGIAPKHLRTSQVRSWGDVEVLLVEAANSLVLLDDSHSLALRRLALAVRNSWLSRAQSVGIGLSPSDLVAAGVNTLACLAVVAEGGGDAHLWRESGGWRARIVTPTWAAEPDSQSSASDAVLALWSRAKDDPSWLRERTLISELLGLAGQLMNERPTVLAPEPPPAQPPEPPPAPRPLPANLAERFGALVADLLAEGGAKAELGRRIIWLAADDDQAGPDYAGEDGWWGACEQVARDAFEHWVRRWDPLRAPPPVGPLDLLPEWGWQEAGRPEVWWGESSDDAEGAALAESARVGRSHRLLRVVAETELAPRGHWRMRPVGGDE